MFLLLSGLKVMSRDDMGSGLRPLNHTYTPKVDEDLTDPILNGEVKCFTRRVRYSSNSRSENLSIPCAVSTVSSNKKDHSSSSSSGTYMMGCGLHFTNTVNSVNSLDRASTNTYDLVQQSHVPCTLGLDQSPLMAFQSYPRGNSVTDHNLVHGRPCIGSPLDTRNHGVLGVNVDAGIRTTEESCAVNVPEPHDSFIVGHQINSATNQQNSLINMGTAQANSGGGSKRCLLLGPPTINNNALRPQLVENLMNHDASSVALLSQASDGGQVGKGCREMSNTGQSESHEKYYGRMLVDSTGSNSDLGPQSVFSCSHSTLETGVGIYHAQEGINNVLSLENSASGGSAALQVVNSYSLNNDTTNSSSINQQNTERHSSNLHMQHLSESYLSPIIGNVKPGIAGGRGVVSGITYQSYLVTSSESPAGNQFVPHGSSVHGSTRAPSSSLPLQNTAHTTFHVLGNCHMQGHSNVSKVSAKTTFRQESTISPQHGRAGEVPNTVKRPELHQISNIPIGPSRKRGAPQFPLAAKNVIRRKNQSTSSPYKSSSMRTSLVPPAEQTAASLQSITSSYIPETATSLQPATNPSVPSSTHNATASQPMHQVALPAPQLAQRYQLVPGLGLMPPIIPEFHLPNQPLQYASSQYQNPLARPSLHAPIRAAPSLPQQAKCMGLLPNQQQRFSPLYSPHQFSVHPYNPSPPQYTPSTHPGQIISHIPRPPAALSQCTLPAPRAAPRAFASRSAHPWLKPIKPYAVPYARIKWQGENEAAQEIGYKCFLCKRDLRYTPDGPMALPLNPPCVSVLPCGHTFHQVCLEQITPQDQAEEPPCIPCAVGEE